jgi:hypothetical protein
LGLRAGVLDDPKIVNEAAVQMELYVERKPAWLKAVEGAQQRDAELGILWSCLLIRAG